MKYSFKYFLYLLVLIFLGSLTKVRSQNSLDSGVAIKATIDINSFADKFRYSNYNISLVAGIGIHPFSIKELYPTIHAGVLLYRKGDLISSYSRRGFFKNNYLDFHLDVSLTTGVYKNSTNFLIREVPLYHFADFTVNPLENPYTDFSFTIGKNIIWFTDSYKKEQPQKIGFTGLMVARRFQISTYNDGSIWAKVGLGDGLDRYYTGGGMIAYHLNSNNTISNLELSFHKFTGHEMYAFDAANQLQLDFIPFKKKETYYYSKSRFRFTATSLKNNSSVHITLHNPDKDPQDWIHFIGQDTYHPDIFPNKGFFWRKIGIGSSWLHMNNR